LGSSKAIGDDVDELEGPPSMAIGDEVDELEGPLATGAEDDAHAGPLAGASVRATPSPLGETSSTRMGPIVWPSCTSSHVSAEAMPLASRRGGR
jgi:hypothetical protein